MASVTITNISIDPAVLPYPFAEVLAGLGSVTYAGTPADVLALVGTMPAGFRLIEGPARDSRTYPLTVWNVDDTQSIEIADADEVAKVFIGMVDYLTLEHQAGAKAKVAIQ